MTDRLNKQQVVIPIRTFIYASVLFEYPFPVVTTYIRLYVYSSKSNGKLTNIRDAANVFIKPLYSS